MMFHAVRSLFDTTSLLNSRFGIFSFKESPTEIPRRLFFSHLFIFVLLHLSPAQSFYEGEFRVRLLHIPDLASSYSPVIFQQKLFFISESPKSFTFLFLRRKKKPTQDIFYAPLTDAIQVTQSHPLSAPLNSRHHEGGFYFSKGGCYITRNSELQGGRIINKKFPSQIVYCSRLENENYTEAAPIRFRLSDTLSFGHPFVLGDSLMYLVSDMPGGFGGSDIYFSRKVNGEWDKPINCGETVNSPGNELFPSFYNGQLFFSSDKPGGAGKLDIYTCFGQHNNFSAPYFLSSPINSAADDFCFFLNEDNQTGYFSSSRGTHDAIYFFQYSASPEKIICNPVKFNNYCFTFFEESLSKGMDTSQVMFEWSFGDGQKSNRAKVTHCFPGEGNYLVQLNMVDKSSGVAFFNQASYEMQIRNIEQMYIDAQDTVLAGTRVEFNSYHSNLSSFTPQHLEWDFGDGKRENFSLVNRVFDAPGNYIVKLKAIGIKNNNHHSECVSRELVVLPKSYNGVISSRRNVPLYFNPKFALKEESLTKDRNEATEKQTPPKLINPVPESGQLARFYESNTLDTSTNYRLHLGGSDKPMNNNDINFKNLDSVSTFQLNGRSQYFYGKYISPQASFPAFKKLKALGFTPFVFTFQGDDVDENFNPVVLQRLMMNNFSAIQDSVKMNVYFSQGSSILSEDERKAIIMLSKKFGSPDFIFELKGYADGQGGAGYNLELSKKRNEAVLQILYDNGVSSQQIQVINVGAINAEIFQTEEQLQHDRRVEIHVFRKM